MPATRNDVTHKPIMVDTTRKSSWRFFDRMGKVIVVWANSKQEARDHAIEQGWSLVNDYKEFGDDEGSN